jgi:folate-dependent phosphoribosylglycinamide formyltransferase PurN
MALTPFHDPSRGALRIAGFMSGSGTNLRRILEHQEALRLARGRAPYEVAVIFSDTADSNASAIGKDHDIPVVIRDLRGYCRHRDKPRRDMALRAQYDAETLAALRPFGVQAAAFAGYMSIASPVLVGGLLSVNVHPADLSIRKGGTRKYKGDHAVADALREGEAHLASSTHIVEPEVDEGRILLISPPIDVVVGEGLSIEKDLDAIAAANQDRLKEAGDWVIFPATLQLIAEGRFAHDEAGTVHFDGRPAPDGVRYDARLVTPAAQV